MMSNNLLNAVVGASPLLPLASVLSPGGKAGTALGVGPLLTWQSLSSRRAWATTRLAAVTQQLRTPIIIASQILALAAIYTLAYLVRFDGAVPPEHRELAVATLPLVVALKLAAFLAMKTHRGGWLYATLADMGNIVEAATLGAVAVVVAGFFWSGTPIPRSIIALDWAGTVLLLGGIRGTTRILRERYLPMVNHRPSDPVLVVGASEAGLALIRALRGQPRLGLRVVGVLDADSRLRGRITSGVPILGPSGELRRLVATHGVKSVLVPTPAVPPQEIRVLVNACGAAGVKLLVVPAFDALLSGRFVIRPRNVEIHDLLSREPVRLDVKSVGRFLRGRVVLVTGAAGSIGSELCRQVLGFSPARLVLLDHAENGLFFVERECGARVRGGGCGALRRQRHRRGSPPGSVRQVSARSGTPRRGAQACADDGGKPRRGGQKQRHRHPDAGRRGTAGRRRGVRDDLDRQGR